MAILTQAEKEFLDVFLHEATTSPFFSGPAIKALYAIGVEYHDISYIAWAYEQDVPRTSFELGRRGTAAPLVDSGVCLATEQGNPTDLARETKTSRQALSSPRL